MDSSWPLATFRIGPARKSSPFDLIIYPLLSTLVRSRWRDIGLAFFAFWLTLTSSRSYPLCQRLFMRGFRFRSTLKKWPTRKACVVDKRVGWVLAKCFFFFRFHGPKYPGYQRFILACDYELRRPRAEDTSGEAARENNVVPRVTRSMKTQKTTWPISSHHACQHACFSHRSLFKTWPKPETAHEKPLAQGRTETKSRSIKTLRKARPISSHHARSTMHVLISYLTFNKFICYNEF